MAKVIAKRLRNAVSEAISALFERTKARLQGKDFKGNAIYFQIIRDFGVNDSVEGVYRDALVNEIGNKGEINKEVVEAHNDEVSHLIDALKSKTTNQALDAIKSGDQDSIKEVFDKAKYHLDTIVTTELARTQNTALEDAASQVAADMGISDPVMFAIGKWDDRTCKYCKAMFHCSSNPSIPKVWKLSEMHYEYMKSKTWSGEIHKPPIHPKCRDRMTMLSPGFGFNSSGNVEYKREGYDEYMEQKKRGD